MTANIHPTRRKLTAPQLARQMGVAPKKIIEWIRSGELRAIDLARKPGNRPRYAIDLADIAAFEQSREVVPSAGDSRSQRLRRPAKQNGVKEFF